LLKDTFIAWRDDNASRLAAALSYYTLFSLTPLLVIAIAVAGQIYGQNARARIAAQAGRILGHQVADALGVIIENASAPSSGLIAGTIGVVTLLIGASGVFSQLIGAFDVIWRVRPTEERGFLGTVKDRLLAFVMVLVIGFLILLTFIVSAVIAGANKLASGFAPPSVDIAPFLNAVVSVVLITLLFAIIYRVLPRVTLPWRDLWIGSAVTAALFVLGKELIGLYLGFSNPSSGFGAAGSVIVLLIFVYYAAQVFLFGAEFTKLYAQRFGSRPQLDEAVERYRIVPEDEPTMRAVAASLPAQEVQLVPRAVRDAGAGTTARAAQEDEAAITATTQRKSLVWSFVAAVTFLVGLVVGARRH
jgi:membrane protein